MKPRIAILILILLLLMVGIGYAADGLAISRHLLGGGGGSAQSGQFALHASIGQAVTGQTESAPYRLESGFWPGAVSLHTLHLPLIQRSASSQRRAP
jgi:hypothetical protein